MDGEIPSDTRELRLALLNEMLHTVEALELLIGRFHGANLTGEQKAAFERWKTALPELRDNLRVLYTTHFAQGAS